MRQDRSSPVWLGSGWKMNKTISEAIYYSTKLKKFFTEEIDKKHKENIQLFVIPPFTSLYVVCKILNRSGIIVGAQNMHWELNGPFTGEISPVMIKDCGAQIVELGHSERRLYFCEDYQKVNLKIRAAINNGLHPLLCVGEDLDEKMSKRSKEVILSQLHTALKDVQPSEICNIMIAYEPTWSIGEKGVAADPGYVEEIALFIREQLLRMFGQSADGVSILYGGSVDRSNVTSFTQVKDINGVFIGRASWDVISFIEIIRIVAQLI